MGEEPDHILRNRSGWDGWAADFVTPGEASWARDEPAWGVWEVSESSLGVLPEDLEGKDTVELGCGTGYVSAWLARRGARPVGIDNSEQQLATAARLQRERGLSFPLIHGNAEVLPFEDERFDYAISEYGASIWADPHRWIPEAARVLRPGGELTFLVNGTLLVLCMGELEDDPTTPTMIRDHFGMHRFEWSDTPVVEFHLGYGDWIRLLRANGFEIMDLIEIRPPEGASTIEMFDVAPLEWARRWPSEEIWKVRKRV